MNAAIPKFFIVQVCFLGTGIRELGSQVSASEVRNIHLFIGHTHWDHIMGFPFFPPVYQNRCTIHIYAAPGFSKSTQEIITGMLDHDYYPVRLDEMQARFVFHELRDVGSENHQVGGQLGFVGLLHRCHVQRH